MRVRNEPRRGRRRERPATDKVDRADQAETETRVIEEVAAEFSTEELLEFLEADQAPVEASPGFRERLREELWELVRRQAATSKG